jgi:hypothetical protein
MAVSTTAQIAGFYNTLFEEAMFVFQAQSLMANLVTLLTGQGLATRKQGVYPTVTTQQAQEGVEVANAQIWNKSAKMELTPYIYHNQVILTESMMTTDPDNTMEAASFEMGRSMAVSVDTNLASTFSGFSTGVGAANNALTLKITAAALAILQNAKVPMPYSYVLHPYHWFDCWVELGQPAAQQAFLGDVANDALKQYNVSNFNGAAWYVNPNIAVDGSSDAVSAIFHREALALDTRKAPQMYVTERPDVAGYGFQLDTEMWYAYGERRDEAGVKITADATQPTGA